MWNSSRMPFILARLVCPENSSKQREKRRAQRSGKEHSALYRLCSFLNSCPRPSCLLCAYACVQDLSINQNGRLGYLAGLAYWCIRISVYLWMEVRREYINKGEKSGTQPCRFYMQFRSQCSFSYALLKCWGSGQFSSALNLEFTWRSLRTLQLVARAPAPHPPCFIRKP